MAELSHAQLDLAAAFFALHESENFVVTVVMWITLTPPRGPLVSVETQCPAVYNDLFHQVKLQPGQGLSVNHSTRELQMSLRDQIKVLGGGLDPEQRELTENL
jgi:hypothetical protein